MMACTSVTGDMVNTASRLEVLNKRANSQFIYSRDVAESGKLNTGGLESKRIRIRGREKPIEVFIIKEISRLTDIA